MLISERFNRSINFLINEKNQLKSLEQSENNSELKLLASDCFEMQTSGHSKSRHYSKRGNYFIRIRRKSGHTFHFYFRQPVRYILFE